MRSAFRRLVFHRFFSRFRDSSGVDLLRAAEQCGLGFTLRPLARINDVISFVGRRTWGCCAREQPAENLAKEATMRRLECANLSIAAALLAMNLAAATPGVQLVDAVKNSDRATIQALLAKHVDLTR